MPTPTPGPGELTKQLPFVRHGGPQGKTEGAGEHAPDPKLPTRVVAVATLRKSTAVLRQVDAYTVTSPRPKRRSAGHAFLQKKRARRGGGGGHRAFFSLSQRGVTFKKHQQNVRSGVAAAAGGGGGPCPGAIRAVPQH